MTSESRDLTSIERSRLSLDSLMLVIIKELQFQSDIEDAPTAAYVKEILSRCGKGVERPNDIKRVAKLLREANIPGYSGYKVARWLEATEEYSENEE